MDVGDGLVGDEDLGDRPVGPDHPAGADREGHVVGRRQRGDGLRDGGSRRGHRQADRQGGGEGGAERRPA